MRYLRATLRNILFPVQQLLLMAESEEIILIFPESLCQLISAQQIQTTMIG